MTLGAVISREPGSRSRSDQSASPQMSLGPPAPALAPCGLPTGFLSLSICLLHSLLSGVVQNAVLSSHRIAWPVHVVPGVGPPSPRPWTRPPVASAWVASGDRSRCRLAAVNVRAQVALLGHGRGTCPRGHTLTGLLRVDLCPERRRGSLPGLDTCGAASLNFLTRSHPRSPGKEPAWRGVYAALGSVC